MALPARIEISLNPAWPADRVAEVLLSTVRDAYRDVLDIEEINNSAHKVWTAMQVLLTGEEMERIRVIPHITVPTTELNAFIATPTSRQGLFIVFDAVLYVRLLEIFTAPRNLAAWSACHVRAAFNPVFTHTHWLGPALRHIDESAGTGSLPDGYSVTSAREFILAHEYGHCLLGHLESRSRTTFRFGDHEFDAYSPQMLDELQADAFARKLVKRNGGLVLWQQMGVDWLFGFMDAVTSMRSRVAWHHGFRLGLPTHPSMETRRLLARQEYDQWRLTSDEPADREQESIDEMLRVRQSVDNFNDVFPAALADAYFVFPKEIIDLHDDVFHRPYSDDDVEQYTQKLVPILEAAGKQLGKKHEKGRLKRLWSRVQSWF